MARLRCKCIATLLVIILGGILLWTSSPQLFNSSPDDRFGIVPVEGLGRAGKEYPTKPPDQVYPTIKAGQLRNQQLGFVLKDDEPIPRVRGNWFEEEVKETVKPVKTIPPPKEPEQKAIPNEGPFVTMIPRLPGTNVISMTLYGSELRYTMGAIRNAELAKSNFPSWTLRIYTETPSNNPRYGLVPQTVLERLRALGVDIHFIDPGEDFVPPMMWRFLVADDTWVDRFIVRDCDSRLIERDAAAVYAWVQSGKPFQCIRDHPSHAAYAVSGGMWGAKPTEIRDVLRRSWREMMRGVRKDYLEDMNFLNYVIWPKVQPHAYCSDSVSCDAYPNAYPFPIPRYGYEHVGEVYNEHDLGRPMDIDIIRHAGENPNCLPGKNVTYVTKTGSWGLLWIIT